MSAALRAGGVRAENLDLVTGVDLLDRRVEQRIRGLIRAKKVGFVWLAPECRTFSTASGKRAPRSAEFPMGKPGLSDKMVRAVRYGNRILEVTCRIAKEALCSGVPWVIENPWQSRMWHAPAILDLRSGLGASVVDDVLDFCQFGAPWRKRTRLMTWRSATRPIARRCCTTELRCSRSGKRHVLLQGSFEGCKRTKTAEPYPLELCTALVPLIRNSVRCPSTLRG